MEENSVQISHCKACVKEKRANRRDQIVNHIGSGTANLSATGEIFSIALQK